MSHPQHPDHIGKYVVEEYLGGGMSNVYRAKEPVLGKTVAVKILKPGTTDPDSRSRFLREAQLAANIGHDHIISVYDFGEHQGQPFMVMEFLRGHDLRAVIKQNLIPDFQAKLRIALQIAEGLQYIHSKNIVHRDIKPENIHVNESGVAKLMDFGIAKRQDLTITQPGFTMGTPYYMAPEQVRGKEVTHLADIYAYGILLFEFLTGTRPISGDTVEQIFYRILQEPIDLTPLKQAGIPESLTTLIAACTAKDPAERPQDFSGICAELAQQIELAKASATAGATTRATIAVKVPPSSKRTVAIAAVAGLLVLGSLTVWLLRPGRPGPVKPDASSLSDASAASRPIDAAPALPAVIQTLGGEMVLVPGGNFLSGPDKKPETLPPFYIGRTEVTNQAYREFLTENHLPVARGLVNAPADYPVVNVTIKQAKEFARWAGLRLPTLKEWEKAARGTDGREYPWGDQKNPEFANVAPNADTSGRIAAVTAFSSGDSPFGIRQMIGNVWEFVDQSRPPSAGAVSNFKSLLKPPPTGDEPWYLMMGGSFNIELPAGATYDSGPVPERFHSEDIGFRCVKDP